MRQVRALSIMSGIDLPWPDHAAAHRQKGLAGLAWCVAIHGRHGICLGVSSDCRLSTQPTWTPSRPNSRNTGLPARDWRRPSARAGAATIRCRRRSRKPWRNSPSASAQRAAFTDNLIRIDRRARPAQPPLGRRDASGRSIPLARYLPPGGLFFAGIATRPVARSREGSGRRPRISPSSALRQSSARARCRGLRANRQTATGALIAA